MLHIFIPHKQPAFNLPHCISFVYPFVRDFTPEQKIVKYGTWINSVTAVATVEECNIIVVPYSIDYYYKHNMQQELEEINNLSLTYNKLIVCGVKGDLSILPPFDNYHLYSAGGQASTGKGKVFGLPVFIGDPVPQFFNNQLTYHTTKTVKPVIGFCGQADASAVKYIRELLIGLRYRLQKITGKHLFENEPLGSTSTTRAKLLNRLEKSPLVTTNFIRRKKYRGGAITAEDKKLLSQAFFDNIQQSQYIICYRGAGNFSVRLYETMASGRIPIIVKSNNLLPLDDYINWRLFPTVDEGNYENIAEVAASFHNALTDNNFVAMQQQARHIWQQCLTYAGFMQQWVNKYDSSNTN